MASYSNIHAYDNSRFYLGDVHHHHGRNRLRYVPGALFNAYGLEHKACHPETRTELLNEIEYWADHATTKTIFWLKGMAGTGKSTIAYTVAERLNQRKSVDCATLGASFFFKRGERDRASAVLFFPTIAHQLGQKIPELAVHINQAVETDPDICDKVLSEQFKTLLEGPLSNVGDCSAPPTYVVVVDALDECQKEDDIRTLLHLCSLLTRTSSSRIRWFVTSRPELPVELGFSRLLPNTSENIILHDIPRATIESELQRF